jgi:protein-S-isoprenylcysteine O-methyltransferase Ste14
MSVATTVPKNVFYFEVLLYMSLILDSLSIAFQDRTPGADLSETTIAAANIVAACMLLLFVFLVNHAAHGRKSWPRWLLTASLVFSVLSLIQILGTYGLQFDSVIEIISCTLTAAGLYCAFTGDAKDWFNA